MYQHLKSKKGKEITKARWKAAGIRYIYIYIYTIYIYIYTIYIYVYIYNIYIYIYYHLKIYSNWPEISLSYFFIPGTELKCLNVFQ